MRVLVCGGRDFNDVTLAYKVLNHFHDIHGFTCVIDGDAKGADRLAGLWAKDIGIESRKYPADWKTYGRAAGHIRNQQMLDEGRPEMVIAFPGGKGTANMISLTKKAGIDLIEVGL